MDFLDKIHFGCWHSQYAQVVRIIWKKSDCPSYKFVRCAWLKRKNLDFLSHLEETLAVYNMFDSCGHCGIIYLPNGQINANIILPASLETKVSQLEYIC